MQFMFASCGVVLYFKFVYTQIHIQMMKERYWVVLKPYLFII